MYWGFLYRMFELGAMPYTKRLVYKSHKFILQSAFPPMSYPSWASIMTGVNPGKHGVFSFTYMDRYSWKSKVFNTLHLEHPRIHEMLSMNGIKSIVINPMPGHPIIPLNGIQVICDIFVPRTLFYPNFMRKYAKRLTNNERTKGNYIERSSKKLIKYLEVVESTVDSLDWNLYWIILRQPDETTHKSPNEISKLSYGFRKMFRIIDKIVKTLASRSDVVVLVSDHGFRECKYAISVNDILLKHNLLYLKESKREKNNIKRNMLLISIKLMQKIPSLARLIRNLYIRLNLTSRLRIRYKQPDMVRSQAFMHSASSFGVYVKNTKAALKVKSTLTAYKGIKWVKYSKQVYRGPYINRAPDILIMPDIDAGFKLASSNVHGVEIIAVSGYEHHPEGILSIYSPEIHLSESARKVPAWIVTPLILILLETPISHLSDDTKILNKIIKLDENIRLYNYVKSWKLLKRILRLKLSHA